MTLVFSSPEDIINDSLTRIGYKQPIGSIFEGSEAARRALDIYGQTRDALLRASDWDFARRDAVLTLLKTAPVGGYIPPAIWTNAYPPLPWSYEYLYPADCLLLRSIKAQAIFLPNYTPKPIPFSVANDNGYTPAKKVILCNVVSPALAVYTAQVTNPLTWEAGFTEALCAQLARRLAPALAANPEIAKAEAVDEQVETAQAKMIKG